MMRARDEVKSSMRLMMLTLYLLLWVHFVACLWFAVVKMEKEWVPVPDWMTGETEFWSEDVWT